MPEKFRFPEQSPEEKFKKERTNWVEQSPELERTLAKQKEYLEESDEEVFQQYVEEMDLKPEDFEKKILDVGAGSAKFAKYTKEHDISSQIYSLEPHFEPEEKEKAVKGRAEEIPFKDGSFDLVLSSGAVPHIFIYLQREQPEVMEEKMKQSLSEMLRVAKKDGEVRFGPVTEGKSFKFQKQFKETLNKVLEELKTEQGISIEEVPRGMVVTKTDKKGKPLLKEQSFLVKLHKPE